MESQEPLENQDKSLQKSQGGEQKPQNTQGKQGLTDKTKLWFSFWGLYILIAWIIYGPVHITETILYFSILTLWPLLMVISVLLLSKYFKNRTGHSTENLVQVGLVLFLILGCLFTPFVLQIALIFNPVKGTFGG